MINYTKIRRFERNIFTPYNKILPHILGLNKKQQSATTFNMTIIKKALLLPSLIKNVCSIFLNVNKN